MQLKTIWHSWLVWWYTIAYLVQSLLHSKGSFCLASQRLEFIFFCINLKLFNIVSYFSLDPLLVGSWMALTWFKLDSAIISYYFSFKTCQYWITINCLDLFNREIISFPLGSNSKVGDRQIKEVSKLFGRNLGLLHFSSICTTKFLFVYRFRAYFKASTTNFS